METSLLLAGICGAATWHHTSNGGRSPKESVSSYRKLVKSIPSNDKQILSALWAFRMTIINLFLRKISTGHHFFDLVNVPSGMS